MISSRSCERFAQLALLATAESAAHVTVLRGIGGPTAAAVGRAVPPPTRKQHHEQAVHPALYLMRDNSADGLLVLAYFCMLMCCLCVCVPAFQHPLFSFCC